MVDQNPEQQTSDTVHSVENALASLWEKAREASLLISTLREEKKQLALKIDALEEEIGEMKSNNLIQQTQLTNVRQELAAESEKNTGNVKLDKEQRNILQQKIRNVILKIDQYLTP